MDGFLQSLAGPDDIVRVVCSREYDPQGREWVVLAYWHGEWRVVKRGSAYACARYAAQVRALN